MTNCGFFAKAFLILSAFAGALSASAEEKKAESEAGSRSVIGNDKQSVSPAAKAEVTAKSIRIATSGQTKSTVQDTTAMTNGTQDDCARGKGL